MSQYLHPQTGIDETDYLVIDFETTGLSPDGGDRACEVGAVRLRGGAVMETFGTLIDPQRPLSAGAYAVNGISPQMLLGAPTFSGVAERLATMMKGAALVAYNAPFDMGFLTHEFRLAGYPPPTNVVVDALALARQLLPGLGKYPQQNVARVAGIALPVRHRALEDAMVTAQLFTIFCSMLRAYDCTRLGDLLRRDLGGVLDAKRTQLVHAALERKQDIRIRYLSPTDYEITDRVVSPRECVELNMGRTKAKYLIGYCHTAKGDRNFRIDRILDLRIMTLTSPSSS